MMEFLGYRPFVTPLPVWDHWYLLLIPLALGVSVVWKSIKCRTMSAVPREAAVITVWIVLGLGGAAVALGVVVGLFR